MGGFAMTFPTNMVGFSVKRSGNADIGSDTTKINLRALCYRYCSGVLVVQPSQFLSYSNKFANIPRNLNGPK